MKYVVINKESELSVQVFESKKEAENLAEKMTNYHQDLYVVKECK